MSAAPRILYVEDNARDADLVARQLRRSPDPPACVDIAPTLAEAREALERSPGYDFVLTDINLPDGRGLDLVAEIRERQRPMAVVVLTGLGDEDLVMAALKAGADDYLPKRDGFHERVAATVRAVLERRRASRPRPSQPLRVLYVEHNRIDVDLTRRHFEDRASHLLLDCVVDAAAALARLPQRPDEPCAYDVLLLDFRLVGDNGLDVLKTVRQERGLDLPVVLVTGQGSEEIAALSMRLGATDYAVKRDNYLLALPAVVENAFHRVRAEREHAALRRLNAELERKVAERTAELAAAKDLAEAANRSKSLFLARMSHDLRTPLNAVLGFSQLLATDPQLAVSPTPAKQLAHIHMAGRHLLEMIDELLDLARIESGGLRLTLEAIDLRALVADCITLTAPLAARSEVTVAPDAGGERVLARADRTRLQQVVVNLLSNAIKYNQRGGRVDVSVDRAGGAARVRVQDTGPGLSAEQQERLFQVFERVGAERSGIEGTGLGLAIARQLVEAMDGRIEVHSAPSQGSTFTVTLPLAAAGDLAAPRVEPAAAPAPAERPVRARRLLYVEDNPVNVALLEGLVAQQPLLSLSVATDGASGLEAARRLRPDLVLIDLDLPDMSGFELVRRLRADPDTATITCVALSAYARQDDVQRALDAGFAGYLTKPLDLVQLLEALDLYG